MLFRSSLNSIAHHARSELAAWSSHFAPSDPMIQGRHVVRADFALSSVHEILQARILEWVAISSSRGSSRCRAQTCINIP